MFLLRTRDLERLPDKSNTKSSQIAEDIQSLSIDSMMMNLGCTAVNLYQELIKTKSSMATIAGLPRTGSVDLTIW
jgi:hypothetical protein